jgi:hypothetical protein
VTDFSVETIRNFALSNKSFIAAVNRRRKELTSQLNEIDTMLGNNENEKEAPRGKPGRKPGRPAKKKAGAGRVGRPAKKKAGTGKVGRPPMRKKRASAPAASGASRGRGRPSKGRYSLRDAVLTVIRNNGGRVDVSEIINHLKKAGYDVSAKTINVMIQHALSALAKSEMIDRSERGVAKITAKGSTATVFVEVTNKAKAPDSPKAAA